MFSNIYPVKEKLFTQNKINKIKISQDKFKFKKLNIQETINNKYSQ